MTTDGMAPLPEFLRQGLMLVHLGIGLQILQPLVHKIKGVVDQLRGLFGGHDAGSKERDGWCEKAIKCVQWEGFNGDGLVRL